MKRLREENIVGSQLEVREDSQPEALGGRGRKTMDDAVKYVQDVKEIFRDQPEIYQNFLATLNDFRAKIIDTAGVIARLKEIFKGYKKLIYGFNAFLPEGYEITLAELMEPLPKKPVEHEDAIAFINKLKKRCRKENQEHIYKSFLNMLNMFSNGDMDLRETYEESSLLLEDHLDLLKEFIKFFPNGSCFAPALHSQHGSTSQHPELGEENYCAPESSDGKNARKSK